MKLSPEAGGRLVLFLLSLELVAVRVRAWDADAGLHDGEGPRWGSRRAVQPTILRQTACRRPIWKVQKKPFPSGM